MAIRLQKPAPGIGSSGVFILKTPFTTLPKERCTCTAIRRLSDYIGDNGDPWAEIYQPNQLPESEYQDDLKVDMEIVTLVTSKGYRILVPMTYVEQYPVQDGIPYHGVGIFVALPPMPVQQDLEFLAKSIREVVTSQAGVDSETSFTETTAIQMATVDDHLVEQDLRKIVIGSDTTFAAQVARLQNELLDAQGQIEQLEKYIIDNLGP